MNKHISYVHHVNVSNTGKSGIQNDSDGLSGCLGMAERIPNADDERWPVAKAIDIFSM